MDEELIDLKREIGKLRQKLDNHDMILQSIVNYLNGVVYLQETN